MDKTPKIDNYIKETIEEILYSGSLDKDVRPKYVDGTPAYTKFVTQKVFKYDISKGEFPVTTLRKTALKGAFYDIEAIYIKQTNNIEEMHPSIHKWWEDFVIKTFTPKELSEKWLDWAYHLNDEKYGDKKPIDFQKSSIGATYGATVKWYNLMNKLLKGLEENPFSRRHSINLNQEQQKINDSHAIQPCAFETLWSVRESDKYDKYDKYNKYNKYNKFEVAERFIDLTLMQRSMDFMTTSSINPIQYVMFGMMVCGHLTYKTGIRHSLGNFLHIIQNCHIYDRHFEAAKEMLKRESLRQPIIRLLKNKDFYSYTIDDFSFILPDGIKKLENTIELAI